jgi:murein DD-endopeptidase MepM/ murein hydrolase activator NlpD
MNEKIEHMHHLHHTLRIKTLAVFVMLLMILLSLPGFAGLRFIVTHAMNAGPRLVANNSAPTPFLHRPYYGDKSILQRTNSYFDHDKPWYDYDGIFVRYDGQKWTSNDGIGICTISVNCYDGHNGYDLNLWFEPVLSAAAGTVIRAGWYDPTNHNDAFGLWVAIDHGNGYVTAYGHLSSLAVYDGEQVGVQWPIGTSGTTGSSTGPHLHYSVFYLPNWYATDPFGWSGSYPDPNIVPDYYLFVSNPATNNTIPDLSGNGSALYPGATMVDDGTTGWSSTGSWTTATSSTDINGNLHYTSTSSGSATATATWQPKLPSSGYYDIGAFVDDNHASSSWAPYTITSADPNNPNTPVTHTIDLDESHIGSFQGPYGPVNTGPQWISLGVYYFNTAQPGYVTLSNATGETGLQISADGMEFVPVPGFGSSPTPTPTTPTPTPNEPAPTPIPTTPTPTSPVYGEAFGPLQNLTTTTPGMTATENVTVRNTGSFTWQASGSDAVSLGYSWLNANGSPVSSTLVEETNTAALASNVAPGQSATLTLQVHTPALAGSYKLVLDMQEQGTWFGSQGASPSITPITIAPSLPETYYFAEGYTGGGTTETLSLTNPSASAASVTVTYLYQSGAPRIRTYQVPALAHSVLNINQEAGANQAVSMIVQSTQPIAAERTMTTQKGSSVSYTDSSGSSSLNTAWYFAEGNTTYGWNTLLSVLNPNAQTVSLKITYLMNGHESSGRVSSYTVAGRARGTIILNNDQPNQQFGMIVTASSPVVVERPEYLINSQYRGGSAVVGATAPQTTWYFGGGNTSLGFIESLVLANPESTATTARIDYLAANGQTATQSVNVPGYSRVEVNVNSAIQQELHSTTISAGAPIIAERQDFFKTSFNGTILGSTTVMGSSALHTSVYIAQGNTTSGHADYLAIGNPNNGTVQAQVVYYLSSGSPIVKSYSLAANARFTVNIQSDVGANMLFGVAVYASQPIVTEQVAFFNSNGANGSYASTGMGV